MFFTSSLLLLTVTCVHSQVILTQSEGSVTVAPGGSLKLTCACSGFSVGGAYTHWIRQAPGKGLEWIIYYYSDSYKSSAQSVQGRFTASKDSSNLYLHMSQLKPEDSAVYYCARSSLWWNSYRQLYKNPALEKNKVDK
uniref:Ig-like domain-containing protein n=1 Tax=Pygocentrus nattereri TaxID=42514 RepID=A0A3B4CIN3_PYGNA